MIRVLVVDDAPIARANIERAFAASPDIETIGTAETAHSALAQTLALKPDVVIINIDLGGGDGVRAAQLVYQHQQSAAIVAIGLDDDRETRIRIANAGARQYLIKPFGGRELVRAVHQVALLGEDASPSSTPMRPQAPGRRQNRTVSPQVKSIAVMGGKGGVGTTVLATNLALIAAHELGVRTGLLDMDLQHGDVRRMLRVDSTYNVLDLARSPLLPSGPALLDSFARAPGGLYVLTGPTRPHVNMDLTPDFMFSLLRTLESTVQVAIFDLPTFITPAAGALLANVDKILVVSGMSDPAVRSTHGLLSLFGDVGIPRENVSVVLNRNEAHSELTRSVVEEMLGLKIAIQIPYDFVLVSNSVNRGAPFAMQRPDAHVTKKVRELAEILLPAGSKPASGAMSSTVV